MGVALSLQKYFQDQGIDYDVLRHKKTGCSSHTAQVSHIPGANIAKAVVLKHKKGYIMAILPASRRVGMEQMGEWLKRPVGMATEAEMEDLFHDCEEGAVPPIGKPYGVKSVIDEGLDKLPDIYFEGGDHRSLIHLTGDQFRHLMEKVPHEKISI